jgi:hypothetical protein
MKLILIKWSVSAVIIYLIFGFVVWEFSPADMSFGARYWIAFCWAISFIVVVALEKLKK